MTKTEAGELYAERMQRVTDAVAHRQPDRVPVVYHSQFWHARYGGITFREAMYDYDRLAEVTRRVVLELQPDMYTPTHRGALGPIMDQVGYRQLQWPGHGTGENVSFQYLDREYMKAEEYEDFIFDPTGFYLSRYLPRIGEAFEGLAELPMLPALYYARLLVGLRAFASPALMRSFAALQKAGEEAQRLADHSDAFAGQMAGLGFPLSQGLSLNSPFDYLGDYFRGSKGIMLDMYRRKEQLLAAMDKIAEFMLRHTASVRSRITNKFVFIPLHWAFDGFMSPQQFKTFFWPPLRKLMLGLVAMDLIPMPFWEHDCSSRLEVIADFPPGKAVYRFERTDLVRAKEVLGDIVCLRGNVPASMLTTGTPEQVDACCRMLIEKVGKGGGFILDGGVGIPDESRPENVKAMFESVRKYAP